MIKCLLEDQDGNEAQTMAIDGASATLAAGARLESCATISGAVKRSGNPKISDCAETQSNDLRRSDAAY